MAFTFDPTLKDLARDEPRDFLATFDEPTNEPVELVNVDLSTITRAADFVVGIGDPLKEILHLDLQAGPDADKHNDVLVYNVLLYQHKKVPVHSILVLLRPQAKHSNQTGTVAYEARPGRGKMEFGYEIVRLWEWPAEGFLTGPLGTAPLAILGKLAEDVALEKGQASVVQQLVERVLKDAAPEKARRLLTASYLLTGLRVRRDVARNLFRGVQAMRESDTYLAILDEGRDEGRLEQTRKMILRQGRELFGEPDKTTTATINALSDLERLERMSVRLVRASGWEEILQTE
jgi:hypothetical protein